MQPYAQQTQSGRSARDLENVAGSWTIKVLVLMHFIIGIVNKQSRDMFG